METGEPPKNARNIGLMYSCCPKCGNTAPSKKGTEHIQAHKVDNESDLPEIVTEPVTELPLLEGVLVTEALTEPGAVDTVTMQTAEASIDAVGSDDVTEPPPSTQKEKPWFKQVLILLGLFVFLAWSIRELMPKRVVTEKVTEGGTHE
ncbi:hypothetical protein [Vibrio sp. OPT18]|uniref:hypothetical protein n=1 Tax=Vibrio sp. OPT18 TaxID=2778641 RepID=UPI0018804679|nr:hypothetical protein [Vibrio sp. OPT18]